MLEKLGEGIGFIFLVIWILLLPFTIAVSFPFILSGIILYFLNVKSWSEKLSNIGILIILWGQTKK